MKKKAIAYWNTFNDNSYIYILKKISSKFMPNILLKHPNLIMLPRNVMIENTNICNLDCRLCSSQRQERAKGMMNYEQWIKVIDQIKGHVETIVLGFMGEPLLNKDTWKQIKYATNKGIKVVMPSNGTILHTQNFDDIFNSKLYRINIGFDGATKETYEYYRRQANFERTLENVKNLCEEKIKRGVKYPEIVLQFIVFKHNEHEIPLIKKIAKEIRPDYLYLKTAALWSEPAKKKNEDLNKEWLPENKEFSRYSDEGIEIKSSSNICPFAFDSCLISWNGDLLLCCMDFHGKFKLGNIFEKSFTAIFKGQDYMKIRTLVVKKQLLMCKNCDLATGDHYGQIIPYDKIDMA